MKTLSCRLCGATAEKKFDEVILKKHRVSYYQCPTCLYGFTEKPYWLEEAYSSSITLLDIGLLERNVRFSRKIANFLFLLGLRRSRGIDLAGGYGVFVRLMRDAGFDFKWVDEFTTNLFAKGFEANKTDIPSALTSFEALEHYENPQLFFDQALARNKDAIFIFSTELFENSLDPKWGYLYPETGQHIGFFQKKSLDFIAEKYAKKITSFRSIHVMHSHQSHLSIKLRLMISSFPLLSQFLFIWVRRLNGSLQNSDVEFLKSSL